MRYLMIFALLLGVGALTVLAPNSAYSKTVSLCNASPVNAYFAIAREEAPKSIRTDGWYHLKDFLKNLPFFTLSVRVP